MEIKSYLNKQKEKVEQAMLKFMPEPTEPFAKHIECMRYSLLAGGKRVRPILCLAAGESVLTEEENVDNLLPAACALEFIHTYSLIHDDLPAMDDDDLRRGKPTNHILYGEANAILAGDGLLTMAFELITDGSLGSLSSEKRLQICNIIAKASGSFGMVGGQALDIEHENKDFPFEMLQTIHKNKTGALITASIHVGAIGANASSEELSSLLGYGNRIGLAFQIVDDLLNATSTTEQLGKAAGSDQEKGKATYPAYFGIEETRNIACKVIAEAKETIKEFDYRADPLRKLADYILSRSH